MASSDAGMMLEIKTVQGQAFKTLIEALKELLTDTCIEFDAQGVKIISMDTSHCVLAHLRLDASKFEHYVCKPPKLTIGVNMLNLYKLVRTINSNDTLTLFIESDDINRLGIKIENGDKNTKTTYRLNLLDLDNQAITIDDAEFNTIITLPSSDFQKICRDMHNIADSIEIKHIGNELIFTCKGDFCNQETVIVDNGGESNGGGSVPSGSIRVQGVFYLKYLVLFTKCTNLCSTVELLLENDYPLIVRYMVASLGMLTLACAPVQTPKS
jgi:proliferating cell nuclear antigen